MAYFNDVTLIGTVAKDPEIYYTRGGTAICDLTILVKETFKRAGGDVEEKSFFDVTAFKVNAENAMKYLHKGDSVMVNGKLKQDRWEDSEGVQQDAVRVLVQDIQFLNQTVLKPRQAQGPARPPRKEFSRPVKNIRPERTSRPKPATKPMVKPDYADYPPVPEIKPKKKPVKTETEAPKDESKEEKK